MSKPIDTSQLVLHIWPGKWNLASTDPTCLAAVLYLQLAAPGQFSISECTNPDQSPNGQLPYLTHAYKTISSLSSIIKYVAARTPSESAPYPNLNASLDVLQKAQTIAWCAYAESYIGDLVAHMLYSLNANWYGTTLPALADAIPIPQRYYVPSRIRESYRARLEAADLWDLPGVEQEVEKPKFGEKPKETEDERKIKFKKVFEREKVLEKARASLDVYVRLLGEKEYFFGNRPTTLDVYLASQLSLLLDAPFPDPLLQTLLTESYPTLVSHTRLVQAQALSISGSNLPMVPPEKSTLGSLVPWNQSRNPSKIKQRTDEEVRFDKMRWGWLGFAFASTGWYIYQSGIIMALRKASVELGAEEKSNE